ncbi:alpha/beta hydrolase family protein [Kordiimonas aquimaris]|uniref:alpha/beta hydrolase family protein n=1 Tax=Kordiimonas aquimaris TaxID=707591 RepID=UPI0021D1DEA6|nr:alpha/beta fold hydrolase [Kordiimonas aquimaris]
MDWHKVVAENGIAVPLLVATSKKKPIASCILMPALGVPAKFYRKLAQGLADGGVTTVVVEQRGNGESSYRAGDGSVFSLTEYLRTDITAAHDWLRQYVEGVPSYIGGHSLGGHVASMFAARHPNEFSGIIHFACGMPYPADFSLLGKMMIKIYAGLVPVSARFFGYFPGQKLGFAGSEYTGLMEDWRQWTQRGTYDIDGFKGTEQQMATYSGRMLSIAIANDNMMTMRAIKRACAPFDNAKITSLILGPKEQGDFLGHINWARKPNGAVSAVLEWLDIKDQDNK